MSIQDSTSILVAPILALVPLWGFKYIRSVTESPVVVRGPLGVGGSGRQFSGGEVLATFPNIDDQLRFAYWGTQGYIAASVEIYGNPDRDGGAHATGSYGQMP